MVNTTADVVDGATTSIANLLASKGADGKISLREAIIATNNSGGADGVFLAAGNYILAVSGAGEEFAATGDLDIRDTLVLAGAGSGTTTIDGGGLDRVLHVQNGATAYVTNVTLTGGGSVTDGAGVRLAGGSQLEMVDAVISNNSATGSGGGLYNLGTAYLEQVRITGNSATTGAGFATNSAAYISNSLIDNNTATGVGGGFYENGSGTPVSLINSTLSNNAGTDGGGAYVTDDVELVHVTIANNTATTGSGGGVYNLSGPGALTLNSSIVADNTSNSGSPDVDGPVTSGGYNIIGDTTGNAGWIGSDQQDTDPLLGPLTDNGGPTPTLSLQASSPAINSGDPSSAILTDQTGALRDSSPDAGAYESTLSTLAPGRQITSEDTAIVFSSGSGNAITVNAGTASTTTRLQVRLTAGNGRMTLSQTAGLTIVDGANGSDSMVIWGTEADISRAARWTTNS